MQAIGWTLYSFMLMFSIICIMNPIHHITYDGIITVIGALDLFAHLLLLHSVTVFEEQSSISTSSSQVLNHNLSSFDQWIMHHHHSITSSPLFHLKCSNLFNSSDLISQDITYAHTKIRK